ncbi:G2/M phase-specific E3 ubiquitin-protein ligase [Dissostichus eleginoides]|uniref:G2/M phase-specific E3 ubiquitin-protein ligase n=1 Tax=Dissostichus eleginoides TaxID=100907 RepID=A0AAD9C4S3_DISEL|nr:G2/M phase-specific E3 ubiquitin-protein ligase [Dissostichus eleginoides]
MGGPQREFFRLLRIEVQTSMGIFEGKAGQVFLTYDQAALDGHKYFQAGRLIAWSVAHGGPCSKALDPSLYQLMCGQEPQLEQFDCSVLPDPGVQSRVKRILQCKTAEDLYALQKDLGDWISECGVPGIFSATIGEIPKIYAYVVKHYIFLRTAKMVNQLTEGMNAFGNLWDLEQITRKKRRTRYTAGVLNIIEDKLTELTFEDLLIFITGADEVPTLGFPNKPSIDFYTQEAGVRRLPYASTCAMTLFLPRGITEEQELHNILNQSVKDSWGFLKV